MNKDEILAKSRAENKNKDIYEQEILKQSSTLAVIIMVILAAVFFITQIFVGEGVNYGIWALVFCSNMATFWVKYVKLHRRFDLVMAIMYTVFILALSGCHIYNLIVPAAGM